VVIGILEAARWIDPAAPAAAIGPDCFGAAAANRLGHAAVVAEVAAESLVAPMAPTASPMMAAYQFDAPMCLEDGLRRDRNQRRSHRRSGAADDHSCGKRHPARVHPISPYREPTTVKNAEPARMFLPTEGASRAKSLRETG